MLSEEKRKALRGLCVLGKSHTEIRSRIVTRQTTIAGLQTEIAFAEKELADVEVKIEAILNQISSASTAPSSNEGAKQVRPEEYRPPELESREAE